MTSFHEEEMFDGLFLSLLGGLLFGRLFYILFYFSEFGMHIDRFIFINGYPGLSFVGLLVGAVISLILFFRFKKIPIFEALDYFVEPLFVALTFGFLGSFFAGVTVGIKTAFPLAIRVGGMTGLRHPTGMYLAVLFFIGIFIAHRLLMQVRRGVHKKGIVFIFSIWYISLVMVLLDGLQVTKPVFGKWSLDFGIALIFLLTFSFYFIYYFRSRLFGPLHKLRSNKHILHDKKHTHKAGGPTKTSSGEHPKTD